MQQDGNPLPLWGTDPTPPGLPLLGLTSYVFVLQSSGIAEDDTTVTFDRRITGPDVLYSRFNSTGPPLFLEAWAQVAAEILHRITSSVHVADHLSHLPDGADEGLNKGPGAGNRQLAVGFALPSDGFLQKIEVLCTATNGATGVIGCQIWRDDDFGLDDDPTNGTLIASASAPIAAGIMEFLF